MQTELIGALIKARQACKALVLKQGRNQAQSYAYVGHEHVLTSGAREALLSNGLVLEQVGVYFIGEIEYATSKGPAKMLRWRGDFLMEHTSGEHRKFTYEATTGANDKAAYVASTALDRIAHMRVLQLAGSASEDPEHDIHDRLQDGAKRAQRAARTLDDVAAKEAELVAPEPELAEAVDVHTHIAELAAVYNHRAETMADIAYVPRTELKLDKLGLWSPFGDCPKFSQRAAKFPGKPYTEAPGIVKHAVMKDEGYATRPASDRLWCEYIVARASIEKLLAGENQNG